MAGVEELASQLGVAPEELVQQLALIGLAATRAAAEQLADADAVERKGFGAVLQEPEIEPEHWRRALERLGARLEGGHPAA